MKPRQGEKRKGGPNEKRGKGGRGRGGEVGRKSVYGSEVHTVPLGERHICFNLNSFTRSSSGVMVAHLIPTLYLRIASADSTVTRSFVWERRRGGCAKI
jgi:hypothetical protein